jgi:ADP-heptose:LPS heptosyltransferase
VLAALIERARVLVCNDTGVSHLADALDVPSVVVFTGSDPARWAPSRPERHRVVRGVRVETASVLREVDAILRREVVAHA